MTTYRLITRAIRLNRGAGNADLVVERPFERDNRGDIKRDARGLTKFLDSDEAPTLVEFDDLCSPSDIRFMLKTGAIVPWHEGMTAIQAAAASVAAADDAIDGEDEGGADG